MQHVWQLTNERRKFMKLLKLFTGFNAEELDAEGQIDNVEGTDIKDENNEDESKKDNTVPAYRYKETAEKWRAAEERESMLLRQNAELEERLNKLEQETNKGLGYKEQIANLKKMRSDFEDDPLKLAEINDAIIDLKAAEIAEAKIKGYEEKTTKENSINKNRETFMKSLKQVEKLVPEIFEVSSPENKRYYEIGQELGLIHMDKYGKFVINENMPTTPLVIAKIIASEKGGNKKNENPKLPISGNKGKGSSAGKKSWAELEKLRKSDKNAYNEYMRKNHALYERKRSRFV
jgi:hypothetical protein